MADENTNQDTNAGGGDAAGQDWRASVLGENAATEAPELYEYMGRFKTPADEVKAHYESHKLNIRKNDDVRTAIEAEMVPGDDWDDDKWKALGDRLRTKDEAAYKVEVPAELAGILPQEALDAEIAEAMADGMPARWVQKHAKRRIDAAAEMVKQLNDTAAKLRADDEKALADELAAAGTDRAVFDRTADRGRDFMAKAAGMEAAPFLEFLKTYGLDTHPAMRKVSATIGDMIKDMPADGGTAGDSGKKEMTQYEKNKARWPNTPSMWGDPDK